MFWIVYSKRKKPLDERQIAVRRRVYEISYRIILGLVFIVLLFAPALFKHEIDVIATKDLYIPGVVQIIFMGYSLPSAVAVWVRGAFSEIAED